MRKLCILIPLLLLCGCHTITAKCRHIAPAQYEAAADMYGKDNVELWLLRLDKPSNGYTHHMQAKVRIDEVWYWIPNRHITEFVESKPQKGCIPQERIK